MTGQDIFITALDLCGLLKENAELPSDVADLKQRAVSLLNIIIAENAVLDGRIKRVEHKVSKINKLEDTVDCCDILCSSVLPYGLARLMMIGEDDALAADFNKLYSEARLNAILFGKAVTKPITEVYE